MRLQHAAVALYIAGVAPCFAAEKGGFTVLGVGTKSCGTVVADFKEGGIRKVINTAWVTGYLTAVNERVDNNRSNIAAGTNPDAWELWINNYCNANPLHDLHLATQTLVAELAKRRP